MSLEQGDGPSGRVGAGADSEDGATGTAGSVPIVSEDGTFLSRLDRDLQRAYIWEDVQVYLSRAVYRGAAFGVLMGLVCGGIGLLVVFSPAVNVGVFPRRTILAYVVGVGVATVVGVLTGVAVSLGYYRYLPRYLASRRKRRIERHLPDTVSFMYGLAKGGMSHIDVFRETAAATDAYDEVAMEFARIVRKMEFGTANRQAVREVAATTPSPEMQKFLLSMTGLLETGGNFDRWLADQQNKFDKQARAAQEEELDFIDLLNEISLFMSMGPVFLIVILFAAQMLGYAVIVPILVTGYVGVPLVGLAVLVLIDTVTRDNMVTGEIDVSEGQLSLTAGAKTGVFSMGVFGELVNHPDFGDHFRRLGYQEMRRRVGEAIASPGETMVKYPQWTTAVAVPIAFIVVVIEAAAGLAPTGPAVLGPVTVPFPSLPALYEAPVAWTVTWLFVPVFIIAAPYAVAYELKARYRRQVMADLTGSLRDMAEANAAGRPLLQAVHRTHEYGSGPLSEELGRVSRGVARGSPLDDELIAMVNRVRHPRLARTIKPVVRAQQAANDISNVLRTVATVSEHQDDIKRDRNIRTQQHAIFGVMSFVVLALIFIVLQINWIPQIEAIQAGAQTAGTGQQAGGSGQLQSLASIPTGQISALFFHTICIQAVISGLTIGKMRVDDIRAGVKYVLGFLIVGALGWQVAMASIA